MVRKILFMSEGEFEGLSSEQIQRLTVTTEHPRFGNDLTLCALIGNSHFEDLRHSHRESLAEEEQALFTVVGTRSGQVAIATKLFLYLQ